MTAALQPGESRSGTVDVMRGTVASLTQQQRERLLDRRGAMAAGPAEVRDSVAGFIDDVRARGDSALRDMADRFDGVQLDALEVPRAACQRALADLDAGVRAALEHAAGNIAAFHRAQLPQTLELETEPGIVLGRRADALARIGVYAPGGRAAYPSSVLMGVVPARVAGVAEVIVCSPPGADGLPPAAVLAACEIAGADRVFAVGGAGAIAAMAFGTASVPAVDRIVGPGNAWVTEAKRQVNGTVGIDSPAGPSELLVLADATADARLVAAELVAQAEHDPDAAVVLVSTDGRLCAAVAAEIASLLATQPRADIVRAALAASGALLEAAGLDEAVRFARDYAPEHLLVLTLEPRALLPELRCAGTIFLGPASSVAFGDYITGANHVLPTAGLARAWSGLSVLDFMRWTTYQQLTPVAAARVAAPTACLADAEGLPGHALAARLRAAPQPGPADTAAVVPLREAYGSIHPYDPGRTPCETDLSDNTNLFGAPPALHGQAAAAGEATITRYPAVYVPALKQALARIVGVEPENIATGCGSDDVIDSALRAFCEPGALVAYAEPTFGMVPAFARMNAALPLAVPLAPGFALDDAALLAARARMTYLCRPNNPTGTAFDRQATERVCTGAAGVVLVDEAYADFADDDMATFAAGSERTIVLRTLSKAYGMAGLRIGFAVGPAALIAEVEKSRGPYKVSGVAEAAALRVLSVDLGWVRARIGEVRENRERLREALRERGIRTFATAANFVLLQVPGTAADWNGRLRAQGVAVRPFAALPQAGECLRVSVGPWPMVQRFLDAFDNALNTVRTA
jgi:histidinol dehydrogenase